MGKLIKNTGSHRRRTSVGQAQKKKKPVLHRCTTCHGAGRLGCEFCRGRGETRTGSNLYGDAILSTCPACYGTRLARCYKCKGNGLV